MSYKILKTIQMDLSTKSINRAIQEVKQFKKQLKDACWELVRVLTMEGVEIAKMQVASMDAVYTGELEQSIQGLFFPGERRGYVIADCVYAIYVEYGTGVVGAGLVDGSDPHPAAEANGWDYDVRNHGEEGWFYRNDKDGHVYWTQGFVSRPFMLNTLRWLEEAAPKRMSEMLSQM